MSAFRARELDCSELRLGQENLRYFFGYSCEAALGSLLADEFGDYSAILLLIDHGARQHAARLLTALSARARVLPIIVRASEHDKTLGLVQDLLEQAVAGCVTRDSIVVAMGGGIVANLAGMVAALLYRGVPLAHLPTTPVAAFDAVLSAKQAVNLASGKNLCGTYLTPVLIGCDLAWLQTVPHDQLMTGVIEMAKNVLICLPGDADKFRASLSSLRSCPEQALRSLLEIGIAAKAPLLAADPHERKEALLFEYGHTVGHALEFAAGGRMSHGEAVGWGMLAAAEVARQVCGLPADAVGMHRELTSSLLSGQRLAAIDIAAVKELLRADNKRGYIRERADMVAMVLLEQLGRPAVLDSRPLVAVPRALVENAVDLLRKES